MNKAVNKVVGQMADLMDERDTLKDIIKEARGAMQQMRPYTFSHASTEKTAAWDTLLKKLEEV